MEYIKLFHSLFYSNYIYSISYWNNHIINPVVLDHHTIELYNSLGMLVVVGDRLRHLAIP